MSIHRMRVDVSKFPMFSEFLAIEYSDKGEEGFRHLVPMYVLDDIGIIMKELLEDGGYSALKEIEVFDKNENRRKYVVGELEERLNDRGISCIEVGGEDGD